MWKVKRMTCSFFLLICSGEVRVLSGPPEQHVMIVLFIYVS